MNWDDINLRDGCGNNRVGVIQNTACNLYFYLQNWYIYTFISLKVHLAYLNNFLYEFFFMWGFHSFGDHSPWRATNFDLYSALIAIRQRGFFYVPHLPWHGPTLYNGHLRGPVTLTPVTERLAVQRLYYMFYRLKVVLHSVLNGLNHEDSAIE